MHWIKQFIPAHYIHHINRKLYDNLDGLKTNICKIVALFFAYVGIIIMQSLKETIYSIKILTDIAQDCGLSINKAKSNIHIYNSKEQPDHIEGIPVTNKINYLGVTTQIRKTVSNYIKKSVSIKPDTD